MLACAGAGLGTLVLALVVDGNPSGADIAWGLLAGVGSGIGTAFLYRGFAKGRMGVVAPVSAVGAALLPAAIGVLTGERPSAIVWVGMVAALPGIWLVSREPPDRCGVRRREGAGVRSTASSPGRASACSSPPSARCPTARATGR